MNFQGSLCRYAGKSWSVETADTVDCPLDEVVERIALLRWVEADVSSDSKLQAIVVMRPEKIILLIRMLPSF